MVKISELISKFVISLYNGNMEGVVENVLLDNSTHKAKYLVLFDQMNDATYLLPTDKIYAVGCDAISIKNNAVLDLYESKTKELLELFNPINSTVFSVTGQGLGVVNDVILTDKFLVTHLVIDGKSYPMNDIAAYGDKMTLLQDPEHKINVKNFYSKTRKIIAQNDTRLVNILDTPVPAIGLSLPEEPTATYLKPTLTPNRAIANYAFLINRKVQKNITGTNGSLLIKQNSRINTQTINIARQNGKLKELTKYSM